MKELDYYDEIVDRLEKIGCLETRMDVMDSIILSAVFSVWDNEKGKEYFLKRLNAHFEKEGV
jgi:hypothetical protein